MSPAEKTLWVVLPLQVVQLVLWFIVVLVAC